MKVFMQDTIEKYNMVNSRDRIICGVSGGADSVAMLRGLLLLKERLSFELCVAHLNHMLRGEESERDAEFVKELCNKYGVEFFGENTDIGVLAAESGESIELAARNARYSFFDRVMSNWGGNKIATAHNADDNLETVIMHLVRGSALNGLGGIPPIRGNIIRPLIETTREQILDFLSSIGQSYVEDSTNSQRLYTRNKIRLDVLPVLNSINAKAAEAVAKSSMLLREDEEFLTDMANEIVYKAGLCYNTAIDVSYLLSLQLPLQRRVVLQLARAAIGFENYYLEFERICDIIKLVHSESPSAMINLPNGLIVKREYDKLIFSTETENSVFNEVDIICGETVLFGEYEISCKPLMESENCNSGKNGFAIPESMITELSVRSRKTGDCIKLSGRPAKTLKKLFIDEKIPKDKRENIPVLTAGGKVIAVYGFGADSCVSASDKEKKYWVEMRRTRI